MTNQPIMWYQLGGLFTYLGCDGEDDLHQGCAAEKPAASVMLSCQY